MSDGSLRNGAEFVTPILGWDDLPMRSFYKQEVHIHKAFGTLESRGGTAFQNQYRGR